MRLTPDKKLHSREHLLADDLSRMMGEQKKFPAYLGIAILYDESDLRALSRRVLEKQDLPRDARGKYFFAALRGLYPKSGARLKRSPRKKKKRLPKNVMPENTLPILKEPHQILRGLTHEVGRETIATRRIQNLIRAMKTTLAETLDGVGLAAPQIGEPLQIFIVSEEASEIDRRRTADKLPPGEVIAEKKDHSEKKQWQYQVFINPKVKKLSRALTKDTEGCLSVPGVFGTVDRREKITVEAYDEHGKKFTRGASRFFARVIQHEFDHLNGALFIDKAENLMKIPSSAKSDER